MRCDLFLSRTPGNAKVCTPLHKFVVVYVPHHRTKLT